MNFTSKPSSAPKRAALYLRVSTGRQAEGEVSIPSQRDLTTRYCQAHDWSVAAEFVEPGASATDDRRPVFQRMLEEAASSDRRFDVICVHAFSRFYRNGAEMELTIRRLRKLGVEVVSVTQPTGDDPSQELMRQIIGIFDEYTSRENGKNVIRSMRESAKQGFWNGARPPLGYRVVEAERRGSKIKKRLDADPVEAELVRLIFTLYADGDGSSRPLGVKETTKWLNAHGHRTRLGSTFGVGPVHDILRNKVYATGKWPYGVRSARTGTLHDPSTIIEIDVPKIITMALFERVQEKLSRHNPKVTPPRIVNGPSLLTGLTVCANCGSSMTRTGTVRRQRSYSYYSCSSYHRKGGAACKRHHIAAQKLDDLIIKNIKEQLLVPERLSLVLNELIKRQVRKIDGVTQRQSALEAEVALKNEKLSRLYKAIEDGVVEMDAQLKERIQTLKQERDIALASLARIGTHEAERFAMTPEKIEAFARLMAEKLDSADTQSRRAYLSSVIDRIEVGEKKVKILGHKDSLATAVAGRPAQKVCGFVREWRARRDSNP